MPVPGEFARALPGRLGPFLTLDPTEPAPPAGYIGDATTPRRVIGSPTGFNAFRVTGPGLTGTCANGTASCVETNLFLVQGKIQPGGAAAALSAGTLDFGDVPTTPAVSKPLVYANIGSVPVTVGSAAITGTGAAAFGQTNDCPVAPATLAVGARCTFTVTYTPDPGQASAATLTITDDTPTATRNVALKGSNLGVMFVSDPAPPAGLNFGTVPVGTTSPEDNVVIGNSGNGPLTVSTIAVTGPSAVHYQLGPNNTCSGTPVAPGGGCEIGVQFAPTTTGSKTASLQVTDANGKIVNVPLSGTGGTAAPAPGGDTVAPTLTAQSPAANATGVAPGANVTATFSEPVQGVSTATFQLTNPTGQVITATVIQATGTNQWVLNPSRNLARNTLYTVTLTGGTTAIRDAANNPFATTSWSFRTR